ncbi:MAG: hypothetical protein Q9218_007717, partial [Villophora microphyllina]
MTMNNSSSVVGDNPLQSMLQISKAVGQLVSAELFGVTPMEDGTFEVDLTRVRFRLSYYKHDSPADDPKGVIELLRAVTDYYEVGSL